MKKIAIVGVVILVLVVLVSGCTSYNNTTSNQTSGLTLQVISNNSWNGTLADSNGTQNISGNGNATYNLGQTPGAVTASLQNNGNGNLTVELVTKNGNIAGSESTSAYHGIVTLKPNS
ncbi:MAG: hypothetical protein K8E24_009675 [Methanobacterium paludis]|nr:hypothetical protein [Methanobacterium paludis]